MKVNKGYKYRLYPTKEQEQLLKQIAGNNRFLWNQLLSFNNECREKFEESFYRYKLQDWILYLKEQYEFLTLSYSQSLQYQAYLLDKTMKRAFDSDIVKQRQKAIAKAMEEKDEEKKKKKLAKAYNHGFPKFKKKSNFNDSICYPQHFEIQKEYVKLPKLGWIKYIHHRDYDGIPKLITITQDGNQWYCSICCELDIEEKEIKTDNVIGIDLGLRQFAVFSDGTMIDNPKIYRNKEKKIKREQKILSRREKGSNRRKKQQLKLHKIHRSIRNQRKDFLHKLVHDMIAKYDGFVVENLSSKNMMKNHKLAKSIGDASWSEFIRILEYMCKWNSKSFEKIDRWYASSQICSNCGNKKEMPLKFRTYECPECGIIIDRDYNASLNIFEFTSENTGGTPEIYYGQGEDSLELIEELSKQTVTV